MIALAGDRAGALCVLIGARQHCAAQPGGQTGENRTRKALSGKRARKKQSARLLGHEAVKSDHDPDDSQTVFWGAFGREHDSGFHPGRCGDAQCMVPQRLSLSCSACQARAIANAKRPNRRTDSAAPVSGQDYPVSYRTELLLVLGILEFRHGLELLLGAAHDSVIRIPLVLGRGRRRAAASRSRRR